MPAAAPQSACQVGCLTKLRQESRYAGHACASASSYQPGSSFQLTACGGSSAGASGGAGGAGGTGGASGGAGGGAGGTVVHAASAASTKIAARTPLPRK